MLSKPNMSFVCIWTDCS